jgi:hypothetical protein
MHVAYTLSHSIDNQSEVLRSDYFDLNPTRITTAATRVDFSSFSREFDSSVDRGNSDFDQRHSFIVFSIWDLPGLRKSSSLAPLFRGWRVSQLAAFRSGVPYTVLSTDPLTSPKGRYRKSIALYYFRNEGHRCPLRRRGRWRSRTPRPGRSGGAARSWR